MIGSVIGSVIVVATTAVTLMGAIASATPRPMITESEKQRGLQLMQQPKINKPVEVEYYSDSVSCMKFYMTFHLPKASTGQEMIVKVKFQRPVGRGPFPLVMIFPTIAGETPIEPAAADNLCFARIASVIANINGNHVPAQVPGFEVHDQEFQFAIQTARAIMDYMSWNPDIDKNNIGVMGFSLGGITASLLTGVDSRVKASVIVAGGGNLPSIMAHSDQAEIAKLRQQRMQYLGITSPEALEVFGRKYSLLDPLFYVSPKQRDQILQVVVTDDTKVPTDTQVELWNAYGRPTRWVYQGGHVASIISFAFLNSSEPVQFFQQKLR